MCVSESQASYGTFQYGMEYNFVQFHAHTASEHTVEGGQYDLEIHFVHATRDGDLAVIGFLCNAGSTVSADVQAFEQSLRDSLDNTEGVVINPNLLLNSVDTEK